MNQSTCVPKRWEDKSKKFYVHLQNQVGIKTTRDLLSICNRCDDFYKCETKYDLLMLLLENNSDTRSFNP